MLKRRHSVSIPHNRIRSNPQELKGSPPVQRRLEEAAITPRKSYSLSSIVKKLTDASKRRDNVASKTSAHNLAVKNNVEAFVSKYNEDAKLKIETEIAVKLDSAKVRRENLTASKVQKLSLELQDKFERGSKALESGDNLAELLVEKVKLKEDASSLRREQLIASKVGNLAITNDSKIKRGQLALELQEIEAAHQGNQLNQKLLSAAHRREMTSLFKSIDNGEIAADKQARVLDVKNRNEVLAATQTLSIEQKLKTAEEKRTKATTETIQQLAKSNNDKLRRGAESIKAQNARLKQIHDESQKKLELASDRREQKLQEQKASSLIASAKKNARMQELLALSEAELKAKEKVCIILFHFLCPLPSSQESPHLQRRL